MPDSNKIEIDLNLVKIDDDFDDGLEGSKIITAAQISNKKPKKTEWFRIQGKSLKDISKGVSVQMEGADNIAEDFYVYGTDKFTHRVKEDFKGCKKFYHAVYKTSGGRYGLWPVTIPQNNYKNAWSSTALTIIQAAQKDWVRVAPDMKVGHYQCWIADDQNAFPELIWEIDTKEAIAGAWDDLILAESNYDIHPYVQKHLGGSSIHLSTPDKNLGGADNE